MSEIKFTKQQYESIYSRGENLLISAAAGSGKTLVLVKRIISIMLEEKVDIDKMLIVTFTNAAANQMKEKIREEIEKLLEDQKENTPFLRRQLRRLSYANISTMHSFCIDLLRKNFQYLGIDPNFKIINTASEVVLKDRALADALELEYLEGNEDFKTFVEAYGGRKGERISEIIESLYLKIQSEINPIEWLNENVSNLSTDEIIETVIKYIGENLKTANEIIHEAIRIAEHPEGPNNYLNALEDDLELIERLSSFNGTGEYDNLINSLKNIVFTRLSSKKAQNEELKNKAKQLRDEAKKLLTELKDDFGSKNFDRIDEEVKLSQKYLTVINRIIINYHTKLEVLKSEKSSLSFSDVEHLSVQLLENEEIRSSIVSAIEYIFFDEYQDINPLQEHIIEQLKRDNNLFFVGDIKQSIYRFRLSDPGLFNARYRRYKSETADGRSIDLSQNFRSSPVILKYLNFLFSALMTDDLGEVDYKAEGQALVPGREDLIENGFVSVVINEDSKDENPNDINPNAEYVAKEIKHLVNDCGYEYKDIVILLRTVRNRIEKYEDILRNNSIPYFSDFINVSLNDPEVSIFIDMLRIINNYRDDMALISCLLSPMGGLNEDEIATIRMMDSHVEFTECVENYAVDIDDDISSKLHTFFEKLKRYRVELSKYKLSDFAYYLASDTGYISYLEAMFLGDQKIQNLMAFILRIEEFEDFSHSELSGFLNHVDRLLKSPSESLEPTQLLSGADNVVRIMSIHKSKGLEFPVVFIGDMERQLTLQELKDPFIVDKEMGIGTKVANLELGSIYSSTHRKLIQRKMYDEMKSEEMRLLYVASTRAEERLYMVGKVKDLEKYINKSITTPLNVNIKRSKSMLDWVSSIAFRDAVHQDEIIAFSDIEEETDYFIGDENKNKYKLELNRFGRLDTLQIKEEITIDNLPISELKREEYEELSKVFLFKYPNERMINTPFKKTVSEITAKNISKTDDTTDFPNYFIPERYEIMNKVPKLLMSEELVSRSQLGTLIHFIFQNISIKAHTIESVKDEIQRMIYIELLTENEAKLVDPNIFVKFFSSKLGKRTIMNSNTLKRETAFTMRFEDIFLDGQIDCYFIEDGEIVLFDYKSDSTISLSKYETQLGLYQEALEKATGLKVRERYIYWTSHGKATRL